MIRRCNHHGVDRLGLEYLPEVFNAVPSSANYRLSLPHSFFVWVTHRSDDCSLSTEVLHQILSTPSASDQSQHETFIGAKDPRVRGSIGRSPNNDSGTRVIQEPTSR